MATENLLMQRLAILEAQVAFFKVKDEILTLLNDYGYTLDLGDYSSYEALFAEDCTAIMSFSTHNGRKDLGRWMSDALKGVDRGVHLSSNFEIKLDGDASECRSVRVRSKLHAACHFAGGDLSNCLTLGGIYKWHFTRQNAASQWFIQSVEFEPYWSQGNDALLKAE